MNDSMAHGATQGVVLAPPRWRAALAWTSAILLALLFYLSGLWKITDPEGAAVRMSQARLPESLSLAAAIAFGIVETAAATFLMVPRLRRWGAFLTGVMLLAFLAWFAINYNALRGEDCSCFPWLKRVVGPGFFIGDTIMLALAAVAGIFSPPSRGYRSAVLITSAVTVFAFVSWGVMTVRQTGTRAPDTISVNGQPYSLRQGRVLLYFFDPQCMHCFDAAQKMSHLNWGATRVVGVPIATPQYAPQFLIDTGMKMPLTTDLLLLKRTFPYTAIPSAIALENGQQRASLVRFEGDEPAATLKRLNFIQ